MIILTCAVAFEGDLGMFCVSRAPELILLCMSDRMEMDPRRDPSDAVRNVIWLINAPLRRLTRTNAHCCLAFISPGNVNVSSRVKRHLRRGPRAAVNGASKPRSSSGNSPAALGEYLCESGPRHAARLPACLHISARFVSLCWAVPAVYLVIKDAVGAFSGPVYCS